MGCANKYEFTRLEVLPSFEFERRVTSRQSRNFAFPVWYAVTFSIFVYHSALGQMHDQ